MGQHNLTGLWLIDASIKKYAMPGCWIWILKIQTHLKDLVDVTVSLNSFSLSHTRSYWSESEAPWHDNSLVVYMHLYLMFIYLSSFKYKLIFFGFWFRYKAWGSLLGLQLAERDIIVACIDYRYLVSVQEVQDWVYNLPLVRLPLCLRYSGGQIGCFVVYYSYFLGIESRLFIIFPRTIS